MLLRESSFLFGPRRNGTSPRSCQFRLRKDGTLPPQRSNIGASVVLVETKDFAAPPALSISPVAHSRAMHFI